MPLYVLAYANLCSHNHHRASVCSSVIFDRKNSAAYNAILPNKMKDTPTETDGPPYKSIGVIGCPQCPLFNSSGTAECEQSLR